MLAYIKLYKWIRLDARSTTLCILALLPRDMLLIIVINAMNIISIWAHYENIKLILVGGMF